MAMLGCYVQRRLLKYITFVDQGLTVVFTGQKVSLRVRQDQFLNLESVILTASQNVLKKLFMHPMLINSTATHRMTTKMTSLH
jgi:hypothetical protein